MFTSAEERESALREQRFGALIQALSVVVAAVVLSGRARPAPVQSVSRSRTLSEQIGLAKAQIAAQLQQGDSVGNRGIAYISLNVILGAALVTVVVTDSANRFHFGPHWWAPLCGLGLSTLCFVVAVTADLVPRSFDAAAPRCKRLRLRIGDARRGLVRVLSLGRRGQDPPDVTRGFSTGPELQALHAALTGLPEDQGLLTLLGALDDALLSNTRLLQRIEGFWASLGFLLLMVTLLFGSVDLLVHW
ncbi:MAG TPA: hypothetical protein VN193_16955 [Candidatus Angelobacter sp.]|nr:hypothetical protein [Candidatus Angelobacter sp.]